MNAGSRPADRIALTSGSTTRRLITRWRTATSPSGDTGPSVRCALSTSAVLSGVERSRSNCKSLSKSLRARAGNITTRSRQSVERTLMPIGLDPARRPSCASIAARSPPGASLPASGIAMREAPPFSSTNAARPPGYGVSTMQLGCARRLPAARGRRSRSSADHQCQNPLTAPPDTASPRQMET